MKEWPISKLALFAVAVGLCAVGAVLALLEFKLFWVPFAVAGLVVIAIRTIWPEMSSDSATMIDRKKVSLYSRGSSLTLVGACAALIISLIARSDVTRLVQVSIGLSLAVSVIGVVLMLADSKHHRGH